ncbi:Hypothetical protein GbCGDNIH9_1451 [Granulibacter bethesdensis]|uniref:Uncharacterized protein n=2 Tax=Granulibacter bethesdensis TaxID=364410 RepID=A0AAC9P8P3_9PROT|nr:Hypothetical protein GbCGDNIH9_1451 [Granulibacter bethesdensis]APH62339.1 Hypothetical protein GbCGDNIH8_1451 [Granulibacter bethesdensis]
MLTILCDEKSVAFSTMDVIIMSQSSGRLRLIAGSLLMGGALAGCADHWIKPGASQQEYQYTMAQCKAEGYTYMPANAVPYQVTNGYYSSAGIDCKKTSSGGNDCRQKQVYNPPIWGTRDANEDGRTAVIRACMMRSGWTLQE